MLLDGHTEALVVASLAGLAVSFDELRAANLSIRDLRKANADRCTEVFHPMESWSLTDWACAAAGEMGEACNVIKKLRRLDIGSGFVRRTEKAEPLLQDLADEIADTIIYLDLLAARAGIDLDAAIRAKFNATSERVGSEVRL